MRDRAPQPSDGPVLVTGASSGIGRALCQQFAREGWTVGALARSKEKLRALAEEAKDAKGRILALPADVTKQAEVDAAMGTLLAEGEGPPALAILNAGVYLPVDAPRFDAEAMAQSCNINLTGTARCVEALMPDMVARGAGRIVLVSSVTGYGGLPTSAAYGATKAGLINMAECLEIELKRHGLRVQVVCPGFVATPAQENNDFPKPMMVTADTAASAIRRGIAQNRFEIHFPKTFTLIMKALYALPRPLHLRLVRNFTGWGKRPWEKPSRS